MSLSTLNPAPRDYVGPKKLREGAEVILFSVSPTTSGIAGRSHAWFCETEDDLPFSVIRPVSRPRYSNFFVAVVYIFVDVILARSMTCCRFTSLSLVQYREDKTGRERHYSYIRVHRPLRLRRDPTTATLAEEDERSITAKIRC